MTDLVGPAKGAPKSDLVGPAGRPAGDAIATAGTSCPECGRQFAVVHPNQMFCTPAHKKAFANRQIARGALTPLVMAARMTRGGTCGDTATGKKARQAAERMIQRWVLEDRAAGRMDMVKYVALRISKGFES